MGLKITTDSAFTDTLLPILNGSGQVVPAPIDDILPTAGALFLADMSNARVTDTSFISNASGVIDNLAWQQAQTMISGSNQSTLKGVTAKLFNTGEGLVELTAKKGIHTIVSQTTAVTQHGFAIILPDAIKTYLLANPTHSYFVSAWGRTTRTALTTTVPGSNAWSSIGITASNIGNKLMYNHYGTWAIGGTSLGVRQSQNDQTLGNYIKNAGSAGWGGTVPTLIANLQAYFQYGSKDVFGSTDANKSASGIFYKIYIEDLTVSGRTYAAVDAIDLGLYTAAFASGGRFFGDTYTDPTTIV